MKLLCLRVVALCGFVALLSGCADNIGSYSSTEIAPVDQVVYYIAGTVTDPEGSPVSQVTVVTGDVTVLTSKDGSYTLPVRSVGTHTVYFGQTGYVAMSMDVRIADGSGAYTEVPLNAILYPTTLTAITPSAIDTTFVLASTTGTLAEAGAAPEGDAPTYRSSIGLAIPPGAVSRQLTVSYFAPATAVTNATAGVTALPLAAVNISPDVESFNTTAKVLMTASNPLSSGSLSIVNLYNDEDNATVATTYDATSDVYAASVSHFSDWVFTLPATVTFATGDSIATIDVDNSGNEVSLRGKEVTYSVTAGWKLTSCSDASLTEMFTALLTSYKGCNQGVTTSTRTRSVNVAAGSILRITCTQNQRIETYSFQLTDGSKVTANVLQYLDLTTSYLYVGHSGGSGE